MNEMKDYAELIGTLRLIAKDCHWQLLEDAADAISELQEDAARYRMYVMLWSKRLGIPEEDVRNELDVAMKGTE